MDNFFYIKKALLIFLCFALAACSGEKAKNATLPQIPDSSETSESPLSPGNLPPPEVNSETEFFQRKAVWDSFSPLLRQKILETYSVPAPQNAEAYDTLFGKVFIKEGAEVEVLGGHISAQGKAGDGELISRNFALTSGDACSTGASFLCVSSPHDQDGVVLDVLRVDGALKMSEAAFFGPLDPVAMVSIFKQAANAPLQRVGDYPILPSDLAPVNYQPPRADGATEDPAPVEIGPFEKAVPLSGPGVYQVLVNAWKNTENGAQLESKRFTVYRQGVPLFAQNGVKIYPANREGTPRCDKQHPINIASAPVNVTLADVCIEAELQEEGTPNVGVIVENYSRNDHNELVLNYSGSGALIIEANPTTHQPIVSTMVPLNSGINHFKVRVQNSMLPGIPPEGAVREFELLNAFTRPSLKFSAASIQDGKIVEARSEGEGVNAEFCITTDGTNCLTTWPDASKPKVSLNGVEILPASLRRDSTGQYSALLHPMVGMNTLLIEVPAANGVKVPDYRASFAFGKLNKLYERGQLKETDNFLKRGFSLEIQQYLLSRDMKRVLLSYLNTPDFKASFAASFKSESPGVTNVCTEVEGYSVDTGDSSIEFLPDTTHLGEVDILEFEPRDDNRLHIRARIKDFRGEANLKGLNSTVRVVEQGIDMSFIPITVAVREMTLAVDLTFKRENGAYKIDLVAPASYAVVEIHGYDAADRFAYINPRRNPLAYSLADLYGPGDNLGDTFLKSLKRNLLCGVENGLNNATTGLNQWMADLQKLISYNNQNPFRVPLEFDMLGKRVGVDLAYDFFHAQNIQISARGIQIVNIPLRVTPGPIVLNGVPEAIRNSLIGSISAPDRSLEPSALPPETNDARNFSLKLSEEAINQALFAASFAGMLDIDLDPNFFSNNSIPFIKQVTPTPQDLVFNADSRRFLDLNQNGVNDDSALPILLRLRTDKSLAPYIHFLSQEEIAQMAENVRRKNNGENTPANEQISLNPSLKYFKFTLPNLEISIYRVQPFSEEMGGYKTLCAIKKGSEQKSEQPDIRVEPIIRRGGDAAPNFGMACKQTIGVDYSTDLNGACGSDYDAFTTPARNGPIVSAVPGVADIPLIKYRASITLYGALQGVNREQRLQDKWTVQERPGQPAVLTAVANPPFTNVLRMRFLTKDPYTPQLLIKVLENRTSLTNEDLASGNKIGNILTEALAHDCELFNEVKIPLPSRFVDDPAVQGDFMENLGSLGITSLDLGTQQDQLPLIAPDAAGLYLDLTAHLGIGSALLPSP